MNIECLATKLKTIEFQMQNTSTYKEKKEAEIFNKMLGKGQITDDELEAKVFELWRKTANRYKHNLSDYHAFLWQSKVLGINDFPSCFEKINIPLAPEKSSSIDLMNINFPILSFTGIQLVDFGVEVLLKNQFARTTFSKQFLKELFTEFALNYNVVSYHNFSHAFSLMLMFHQSIEKETELKKIFSQQDICCGLIAALGHDLNHPGHNNGYEIKKKTIHAIKANNQSVLQKKHIEDIWNITRQKPQLDFIAKVKNPNKFKKMVTKLILATDVAKHFQNLEMLKKITKQQKKMSVLDVQQQNFVMEQLFHACDIGNPCLGTQQYLNWAALLSFQFNQQTKLEMKDNLEVTQFLRYTGLKGFFKGQVGFSSGLVLPLWKQLSILLPGTQIFVDNAQKNIQEMKKFGQEAKQ